LRPHFFAAFSPQRSDGKKFVPARYAAECRNSQDAPDNRCLARDVLWRDALQLQIPADSAVRKQQDPKRRAARPKSCFAGAAAPRQNSSDAEQIFHDGAAAGAPDFRTVAGWTNEVSGLDLRSPWKGWGLKLASARRQTLCRARYNKNPKE